MIKIEIIKSKNLYMKFYYIWYLFFKVCQLIKFEFIEKSKEIIE